MKPKLLVKISNIIGLTSIILLIYWIFIFIVINVFGFRVFRENITDTFYMSIIGILALMAGALMTNIMFNLTRIADKQDAEDKQNLKDVKKQGLLFLLSFGVIFLLLMGGDYLTSSKKEKMLINSAKSIINDHKEKVDKLVDYTFTLPWLKETEGSLYLLSKTDKHFPNVSVIVKDTIADSPVYLSYGSSIYHQKDTVPPLKMQFILNTTSEERVYLESVFKDKNKNLRFEHKNGNYELFYPYENNNKIIVIYFSDYQQYGKIGS